MVIHLIKTACILLFVARVPPSVEARSKTSAILGNTTPENGSIIEIEADDETKTVISCQFISESGAEIVGSIRWYINGAEINLAESRIPGVNNITITNSRGRLENTTSTLTLIASGVEVPLSLNDGRIACRPPVGSSEGGESDVQGVFATFLAFRTVTVSWKSSEVKAHENQSSVTVCANAEGWTTSDKTLIIPIILVQSHTATKDEDFSDVPEGIVFTESTACFEIQILDDEIVENDRFSLEMDLPHSVPTQPAGVVDIVVSSATTTITILDDDRATVRFSKGTQAVAESDGSVEVCVEVTGASMVCPVAFSFTVVLSTTSGTAALDEDFMLITRIVRFMACQMMSCVEVPIIEDDIAEDVEVFNVLLEQTPGFDTHISLQEMEETITIVDMKVFFEYTEYIVTESEQTVEVCLTRKEPLLESNTVTLTTGNEGSATANEDYVALTSVPVVPTVPLGRGCVNIAILPDYVIEGLESFSVNIDVDNVTVVLIGDSTTVTIIDSNVCSDGDVRFLEQDGFNLVEICQESLYLPVCHEEWDNFDATVVCRQSGYDEFSIAVLDSGVPTRGETVTNVTCLGTEAHSGECPYNISDAACGRAAVQCSSPSPCPGLSFWCPESSSEDPLCIPRDAVCDGLQDCPVENSDERVCAVVGFTRDSYTVREDDKSVVVCINASFPISPLFLLNPTITLTLSTSEFADDSGDISHGEYYKQTEVQLSFNSGSLTQCVDIEIIDDTAVANSKRGFFLILSPTEDMDLYIDSRRSILSTYALILDDEACTVDEFYCELRRQCMSLHVICDGVSDCYSDDGDPNAGTDETNCEEYCGAEVYEGISWPNTYGSQTVTVPCSEDSNRKVTRECRDGTWAAADYNTCLTFKDILAMNITEGNVAVALGLLTSGVVGAPAMEQNDINVQIVANTLTQIALLVENAPPSTKVMIEMVNDVIAILDSLLQWSEEALRKHGPQYVKNFERILVSLMTSDNFTTELYVMGEEIALLARPITVNLIQFQDNGLPFTISSVYGKPNITDGPKRNRDKIAEVELTSSVFTSEQVALSGDGVAVSIHVYEVPSFFPLPIHKTGPETVVGTPVVSLIVTRGGKQLEVYDLDPLVELTLEITVENATNPRCVFWDFTLETWSTDGCQTQVSDDKSTITCTCTHLTNFAALVDVCRRVEDCETSSEADYILGILSIAGVSLSLVGLLVTIFTLLFFRRLRRRDASKFHIQLCVSIFLMLLVFLVGVQQTSVKAGCVTVSVLIHYFTLVAVMWMGAEALLMFQKLVIVFVRITTRYIVLVSLICWLVPLLVVIIPVAINPDYVIIEPEDSSGGLCFISNTAVFFAAFLAPILAIILFNCVVFAIIVSVLIKHKSRSGFKTSNIKERGSNIRLLMSIIGIMSLFGLTWLFGALTVDKASLAFQILFVVFNSLQGFFIFLFFCVLGRDGRELWLEVLLCGRYKSSYLHQSSTSTFSAEKRAANNVLLSSNTSSTEAQLVEKSIETSAQAFVINYVEFVTMSKGKVEHVDSEPELTIMAEKIEEEVEIDTANGTVNQLQNGGGHSSESDSVPLQHNRHCNSDINHPIIALESQGDAVEKDSSQNNRGNNNTTQKKFHINTTGENTNHLETLQLDA